MIQNFVFIYFRIFSKWSKFQLELGLLRGIFNENRRVKNFINLRFKKFLDNVEKSNHPSQGSVNSANITHCTKIEETLNRKFNIVI